MDRPTSENVAGLLDEEAQPLVLGTFDGTSFTVLEEGGDGYQKCVLHARIGKCPADGCSFDAANQVTDFVVGSEVKLPVRIR